MEDKVEELNNKIRTNMRSQRTLNSKLRNIQILYYYFMKQSERKIMPAEAAQVKKNNREINIICIIVQTTNTLRKFFPLVTSRVAVLEFNTNCKYHF